MDPLATAFVGYWVVRACFGYREARRSQLEEQEARRERIQRLYPPETPEKRRQREERLARLEKEREARLRDLRYLRSLSPSRFEKATCDLYRKLGYEVNQTPLSRDGGFDAVAVKNGERFLVETKRWSSDNKVGRRDIQVLHSAIVDAHADGGIFITTSRFSEAASSYASGKNIQLVEGERLVALMRRAYPAEELVSS